MYFEQFKQIDCTILYSGSMSAGAGAAIDTSFYGSVVVQLIGQGLIEATIEGSNDNSTWNTILLNPVGEIGSPVDSMTMPSGYQFRTAYQYIRYNVAYITGTYTITIIGRAGPGPSAADNVTAAFNKDTPLNVETGLKKDQSGAMMLSDVLYSILVPPGLPPSTSPITTFTVDCLGYASWSLASPANSLTVGGIQISNDGVNWVSIAAYYILGSSDAQYLTASNAVNAANTSIRYGSVFFRYLRISLANSTTTATDRPPTLLLKTINASPVVQTDLLLNGLRPSLAASITGVLPVGGIIVSGSSAGSSKNYPVLIGGVIDGLIPTSDNNSGVPRYLSLDGYGRTNLGINSPYFPGTSNTTAQPTAVSPPSKSSNPLNLLGVIPATVQGSAALNVQETSQFEGQSLTELLAQLLLELRIFNQQLYELPRLIASSQPSTDPPEAFRQDQSVFNQ